MGSGAAFGAIFLVSFVVFFLSVGRFGARFLDAGVSGDVGHHAPSLGVDHLRTGFIANVRESFWAAVNGISIMVRETFAEGALFGRSCSSRALLSKSLANLFVVMALMCFRISTRGY